MYKNYLLSGSISKCSCNYKFIFKILKLDVTFLFQATDDMNDADYTEVDFSHIPSSNSAPCGNICDTVYCTPAIYANHPNVGSSPLYSTVEIH